MDTCRICLNDSEQRYLIAPCACTGTNKFVHRECLNSWRRISTRPDAESKCPNCLTDYQFEPFTNYDYLKKIGVLFTNCIYNIEMIIGMCVIISDISIIPYLTYHISKVDNSIYNTTSSDDINSIIYENNRLYSLGSAYGSAIVINLGISNCILLLIESISNQNCEICFTDLPKRIFSNGCNVLMFLLSFIAGSVTHGILTINWLKKLKRNNRNTCCNDNSHRRIIDLNVQLETPV